MRNTIVKAAVVLLSFCLHIAISHAESLQIQRVRYHNTLAAIEAGDLEEARKNLPSLKDYPLYPYIDYALLTHRLENLSPQAAEAFAAKYSDSLLVAKLRKAWLNYLLEQKKYAYFLQQYAKIEEAPPTKLFCDYLWALIKTDKQQQAFAEIPELWSRPYSQPENCDRVFHVWYQAGHPSIHQAWERIFLAINAKNIKLATYLGRYLQPKDQHQLALLLSLDKEPNPKAVLKKLSGKAQYYGYVRVINKADNAALSEWVHDWHSLTAAAKFSQAEQHQLQKILALALATNHHPEAYNVLRALPAKAHDETTRAWRARAALRSNDFVKVRSAIVAMPEKEQQDPTWIYWLARSFAAEGQDQKATALYQSIANKFDYYGFLAKDALAEPYHFTTLTTKASYAQIARLDNIPGMERAQEFYALGYDGDARSEWLHTMRNIPHDAQYAAAYLAKNWGWHDLAIVAAYRSKHLDDITLRFPLLYRDTIVAQAKVFHVDPTFTYAIVRQESAFNENARSPVGALGLMQLMPNTARLMAKQTGARFKDIEEILKPQLNIRLGTAYAQHVLAKYHNNPIPASAAYNAGPNRVAAWSDDFHPSMPADIWIETIPFSETRDYVKRIATYSMVYSHHLGHERRLTDNWSSIHAVY